MDWKQTREDIWVCSTPIGKLKIEKDFGGYHIYLNEGNVSTVSNNIEDTKDKARTEIFTKYYKLKIYLELNE